MTNKESPSERQRRSKALLAVIIIFLGITFLLNNLTILPWGSWELIWKFWPVVLILAGLQISFGRFWFADFIITIIGLSAITFILALAISATNADFNNFLGRGLRFWNPKMVDQLLQVSTTHSIIPANITYPAVTLDSIFSSDVQKPSIPPQAITIIATGDVIPARSVNYQTVTKKNFIWPYEKTSYLLKDSDVTFVNLEAPLVENCPVTQEGMIFCSDTRNIEGLIYANVKVANLANNHSTNYGKSGIDNTVNILKRANIEAVGILGPTHLDIKGSRVAFLGYNDIGSSFNLIAPANESLIQKEVAQAKNEADIVIVAFHWGDEYTYQPTERQINLAHLAVDSGADLIVGNHPHWIQPVEIYKGKLITYAHGNYIFDQMWSQKTREGVIGRYVFYQNKLISVKFTPVWIDNYGQATLPDNNTSLQIINQMQKESQILKNSLL